MAKYGQFSQLGAEDFIRIFRQFNSCCRKLIKVSAIVFLCLFDYYNSPLMFFGFGMTSNNTNNLAFFSRLIPYSFIRAYIRIIVSFLLYVIYHYIM